VGKRKKRRDRIVRQLRLYDDCTEVYMVLPSNPHVRDEDGEPACEVVRVTGREDASLVALN
jgi:hypothetical protein